MQTSKINLLEKSKSGRDGRQRGNSALDINEAACCLKNAIFSKYISDYLIEKAEEMWDLYEQRIDQYLQEKHFNITCQHSRPQTTLLLEEWAKQQQDNIIECQREIEIICSSHKRRQNDDKYPIQLQSIHQSVISGNSILVPRTPRCIDRLELDETTIDK